MGTTSSSPYDIGEEVNTKLKRKNWHWTLHRGNKRGETGPTANVSIFRAVWSSIGDKQKLAKHAFSKSRTLRHPKLVHFHDGSDGETECMIVMEEVTPFVDWIDEQNNLSEEQLNSLLTCGVKNLLEALNFLHAQGIVHGLVCPESIFVTKSGEFKLWGLDCASNLSSADFGHFQTSENFLAQLASPQYRSPERMGNDWDNLSKNFAMIDVWSLGQMIPNLFESMSPELTSLQRKMISQNSFNRINITQILEQPFLKSNPVVASMTFLDELQLKSHREIVMFFKTFPKLMKKIPNSILIHKVMPAISAGVTRSIGTAADNKAEECRDFVSVSLPIVVEVGKSMTEEEFRQHVVPAILPLFAVTDRSVRIQLLERIDALIQHMDDKTINETLFEPINNGFSDNAKPIRELTLKSMLSLASKLNEKNLNDRLMRSLSKLQVDPEASIRTNTTIFFGKIAGQLQASTRLRVIIPVFLRAMKDPFPYARLAAVRATSACKGFYDPGLIVGKLLPSLTSLMLDPYAPVRDATFDCIQVLVEPVKAYSDKMKSEEEARKKKLVAEEEAKRQKEGPKVGELSITKSPPPKATSSGLNLSSKSNGGGSTSSLSSLGENTRLSDSSFTSSGPPIGLSGNAGGNVGGGLGFRSESDSSFWEAIGDDTTGLAIATNTVAGEDGWGDSSGGGGWDDGWGGDDDDLDLNDVEIPSEKSAVVPPVSSIGSMSLKSPEKSSSSNSNLLFSNSPSTSQTSKKSVEERRQEAKQKRENRSNAKKLSVEKLSDDVKTDDWEW